MRATAGYVEGVKAEYRPIPLDEHQMLGAGDPVQAEENASLRESCAADQIFWNAFAGCSSLARRPVYATSTPRSSWIGMQIRPCIMVPWSAVSQGRTYAASVRD